VFAEPKVFLEAALIEVPTQAQLPAPSESIAALARVPGAKWIGSPHILAAFNATAQMQFGHLRILAAPPAQPELSFAGMSVLPLKGIPDAIVLDVDIELTLTTQATPTSTATTQSVHVRNSFATRDRKATSVTLPVPSSPEASLFVALVPRVLHSSADLRDIFNCKVRQRQAYLDYLNRTQNAATVPQQQH
jgi:hypothetical protein